MKQLQVAKSNSILTPGGAQLLPGADIPPGTLTPERETALLLKGLIVEVLPSEDNPAPAPIRKGVPTRPGSGIPSLWILDPANLEGKDLDDLNVMILERDDSIEPFETIEEAIGQLCMDFEG